MRNTRRRRHAAPEHRAPRPDVLADGVLASHPGAETDLSISIRRRRTAFRLLLVLLPFVVLAAVELLLRVVGSGYSSNLFLPWREGGTNLWVSNAQFTRRFFPFDFAPQPRAFAFPSEKATNTTRIFIMGESAALGEPEPKFGFGPMLRALLRERFPSRRIEVVNLGIVAINSHVIREIARESLTRQGDIWIVYMGNNEMVGPFGAVTVMGAQAPSLIVARATLALKKTRIVQLLGAGLQRLRPTNPSAAEWRGMATFQEKRVRHDDRRTVRVYRNFKKNLQEILEAGRSSGALVLLCTVGTNLKDCPPFASLHSPRMSETELVRWEADYEKGKTAEAAGRVDEALSNYRTAATIDDSYADLQFRMGRCLLSDGQCDEARRCFEKARDYDGLQLRADSSINDSLRRAAASFSSAGVRLIDLEQLMARQSPGGIAGGELFLEHVHLNPEGNYLVAHTLARQIEAALTPHVIEGATGNRSEWLTQSECFAAVGFNSLNRHELLSTIEKLISGPPFNPLENAALMQRLKQEIETLRPATKISRLRVTIPELRRAVGKHPDDSDLRAILADMLQLVSDYDGAEAEWRANTLLLPQSALAFSELGYAQERRGQVEEALRSYRTCLLLQSNYAPGHERLGMLLANQGRYLDAIPHLRWALKARPDAIETRLKLGEALAAEGKKVAALAELRELLRHDPKNREALQFLERESQGK